MDFQLDADQQALFDGLQAILADHGELPQGARHSYSHYDPALQRTLAQTGFLDAARDMGGLEGVLVTLETARLIVLAETTACGLVAGRALPEFGVPGPAAIVEAADLARPIRNLPIAQTLLVIDGADVRIVPSVGLSLEPLESVLGYPYGRLTGALPEGERIAARADAVRQWWRLGLAAEIAGSARAALDFTLDYIRQRHVLGRPVGSFQSVQHRMAWLHAWAEGTRFLALRAGWSGSALDAEQAFSHAAQGISRLVFDLHQFNGGMGVTTEYPLHFWLYRIRALQGECGGMTGSSLAVADRMWGAAG